MIQHATSLNANGSFFFPFLFLFPVVYYSLIRNSNARVASFPFFAPFIYLFYIGRRSYIGMNYVARYTHLSRSKDDLSELHSATVQKKKKETVQRFTSPKKW